MGNLIKSLKKFVTNKNTVTILGVIAGVIILWFFYNSRVTSAIQPKKIPYANKQLSATSPITQEDIDYIEVNNNFLKKVNIITNVNQLIGKYVDSGTSIPAGGLFYQSQVVSEAELPDSVFDKIPDGYTIFQLEVDNVSTYANSIYPGNRIDLYLKGTENGLIIYGKFIQSIEVLAVRDRNGNNVFSSTEKGIPAVLLFAVRDDYYELLRKAEFSREFEIIPVPRNRKYTETQGETGITSDELVQLIESKSRNISQNAIVDNSDQE